MEGGYTSTERDRPSNVLDGNFVLAHLVSHHAEKMNGIGVIRLDRENLPINLLGGLQPAALMMPDRNRQCFGNRRHKEIMTAGRAGRNVFQKDGSQGGDWSIFRPGGARGTVPFSRRGGLFPK